VAADARTTVRARHATVMARAKSTSARTGCKAARVGTAVRIMAKTSVWMRQIPNKSQVRPLAGGGIFPRYARRT